MFIVLQIFLIGRILGDFSQRNSVGAQNIMFSSIHFNNLLEIKVKRANVNCKVRKLGNITWGISSVVI